MRIVCALLTLSVIPHAFCFSINLPWPFHAPQHGQLHLLPKASLSHGADEAADLSFERWLIQEQEVALDRLLANIAPGGRNTEGVAPGAVIASPSKEHPNYFYQCKSMSAFGIAYDRLPTPLLPGTRDAAITISTVVRVYAEEPLAAKARNLSEILRSYTTLQHSLQHSSNPSGDFFTGGLGEPKFHADGSVFTGPWGRPQRDGPALRALTLMRYLRAYNATNPELWSSDDPDVISFFKLLYDANLPANSIIKADLEYTANGWKNTGFDLWEEVQGLHFFTGMIQWRALSEGKKIARLFSDEGAASWYAEQQDDMENFLQQFWDGGKGHLVATLGTSRSGLDCAILLGSIHGNPNADYDAENLSLMYPPWSDEVLVSLLDLVNDQGSRFPINTPTLNPSNKLEGVGVGRYPEDVYDGDGKSSGNPWFLCTASVSEILYRSLAYIAQQEFLHVSEGSLRFWTAVNPEQIIAPGNYTTQDPVFNNTLTMLKALGDGFLKIVKNHADATGSLSEQFDGTTGYEKGASDLTWSYGAVWEAANARLNAERVLAARST
ncbi:MAG: Glucoamylase, intracellular sporulation-specific [Geoglossum simile]|nr:MAG: Glucoamylase, intracellular sporulation-specific [Geoglossum simile]